MRCCGMRPGSKDARIACEKGRPRCAPELHEDCADLRGAAAADGLRQLRVNTGQHYHEAMAGISEVRTSARSNARRTQTLLTSPPPARCPAPWDGHATERIADAIAAFVCR